MYTTGTPIILRTQRKQDKFKELSQFLSISTCVDCGKFQLGRRKVNGHFLFSQQVNRLLVIFKLQIISGFVQIFVL